MIPQEYFLWKSYFNQFFPGMLWNSYIWKLNAGGYIGDDLTKIPLNSPGNFNGRNSQRNL
jgi:hypothetical protein